MTTAIHRTTYKYYSGVPSTLPTSEWLLNPSLTGVSSVPQKYWKVSGDSVVEMTSTEKNLKDQLLAAEVAASAQAEKVISIKPDQDHYSRIYIFSCDFANKETWWIGSKGHHESFNADGVKKKFDLLHGSGNNTAIVNLTHGKVTDEYLIVSPSGGSYAPVVKINGATQTAREPYESSGGHYNIDHAKGELSFFSAPPSGNSVTIDYWYSPEDVGPCIVNGPAPGKKWIISSAEVQFSSDIEITDTMLQNVLVDVPIFDASGNYLFTAVDQKAGPDAVYATAGNILDYTYGSHPIIPAFGGSLRGLTKDTIIFRWDYASTLELKSSLNMRLKAWNKHNRGFGGERATVTIYGVETDE